MEPYMLTQLAKEDKSVVCLLCVSTKERGLDVRSKISCEQQRQLAAIEQRADQLGGFPPPEIVKVFEIRLPQPCVG